MPENYQTIGAFDLSKNKAAAVALNVVGMVLLVFFGLLFLKLTAALRAYNPMAQGLQGSTDSPVKILLFFVELLVIMYLVVVVHEAVHGAFFWLFTGKRPIFGLRATYAFAAAPDWYIPRNFYLWIGLSPLVVLTLLGVLGLLIVPESLLLPLVLLMTINAGGCVGDILTVGWLLLKPVSTLAQDYGDKIVLYGPQPAFEAKEL